MIRAAVLALAAAALSCAPAAAHRHCMRVGPDGKSAGTFEDLDGELPEYVVVIENVDFRAHRRWSSVVGDGPPGFSICSVEECERFKVGMHLPPLKQPEGMSVKALCVRR